MICGRLTESAEQQVEILSVLHSIAPAFIVKRIVLIDVLHR